jgi:predicted dehydrogenase
MADKFLVIGLGSMGRRRIRNLLALRIRPSHILGFDLDAKRSADVEKQYGVRTVTNFEKGFREFKPNAFIISTPPDLHAKYFLLAARRNIHFFVEVTTVDDGYAKLQPLLNKKFIAAPSCTFRYVPAILQMRAMIKKGTIGRVVSFQHYLGQYLPDWHPYEDYRKVYFAQEKTGGAREMFPYEICWLNYLVGGSVQKIVGVNDKYSDLDMTADDIYAAILEYDTGVLGTMMIDLLNRKAARTLRIIGSKGTIEWDWLRYEMKVMLPGHELKILKLDQEKKFNHYNTTENVYVAEMKTFLDAIHGKQPYPYSFTENWKVLKTLFAAERSFSSLKLNRLW